VNGKTVTESFATPVQQRKAEREIEALRRDRQLERSSVVLADGEEWIWNLADQHFLGAIQIVDLYHARQHLWELAHKFHPNDAMKQKEYG